MRKDTANWIALTDYDIETARHMLETGRYLYVIFLCHLSLEKILKAHVAEVTQTLPIKTHDVTAQPPHFASYFVGLKSCLSSWKSAEADSTISPQGFHVLSRRLCEAPCGSAPRDQDG